MPTFNGTASDDTLIGGDNSDTIRGRDGSDLLWGGDGRDNIQGGDGDDFISNYLDLLDDGVRDTLDGGAGDDRIVAGIGDRVDGGNGFDFALFEFGDDTQSVVEDFSQLQPGGAYTFANGSTVTDVEFLNVTLGEGNDRAITGAIPVYLGGGGGDDTLTGGAQDDTFLGGTGSDLLIGGRGDDQLDGSYVDSIFGSADSVDGGAGDDFLLGGARDTLNGGRGDDVFSLTLVFGSSGVDIDLDPFADTGDLSFFGGESQVIDCESGTLRLTDGDDRVNIGRAEIGVLGRFGDDTIIGGDGDDAITGGGDNDKLIGGGGTDTIQFNDNFTGAVQVSLAITRRQDTGDGRDLIRGFENLVGTENSSDSLTGDDGDNQIIGLGGDDTVLGGGGDDVLFGGLRFDTSVFVASDNDRIEGGGGRDAIIGGDGGDTLKGGAGRDVFVYTSYLDSYQTATDLIEDLRRTDKIDLSAYDAVYNTAANEAFVLVDGPSTQAGTAWWEYDAGSDTSRLMLNDLGGDVIEVFIRANGDQRDFDNFVL